MAIKADEAIERIGGLLDEADEIMTKGMTDVEAAMRPSHKAASHSWSPEQAEIQRNAALGKKYAIAMRKPMTRTLRSTFEAEAKATDPSWELPVLEGAVMTKWAEVLMKRARKATRDQRKLRPEFLKKKLRESVSAMDLEEQREAIEKILQRDKMRKNHEINQRQLKRVQTQLKCVIGEDGQRISGSDMPKAFVEYNVEHFQHPRRNGATAADGGDFCNGL